MTDERNARSALRIAIVGLEFGAEFVPIYRDHPQVASVAIADPRESTRAAVADAFGIEDVYPSLDAVLEADRVDAVHIVTGLRDHADHVVAALDAGKHVACTVPMALGFDDIQRIVDARERAGTNYMMMETAAYTREYFFAEQLVASGAMGDIAYARGTHFQDMTDWPAYWLGLPPMFYATHAIAPILRLLDAPVKTVRAIGGGSLAAENRGGYANDFPIESALFQLEGKSTVVEVTRSLFQLARPYTESFSVFGDRAGFEWPQREGIDHPLLYQMAAATSGRGRTVETIVVEPPDRVDLLPESIRRYTKRFVDKDHRSFVQGGGHGGSHPHLVHEFVTSIVENRPAAIDEHTAANWTAAGIAAHASAQQGGELVVIPKF